ncbi:MAG: diphthine--ammonia ligase [Candidatus Nanohaloarchaeota archaeon]|nr:diphthine--ammonia ligase [Candidatus Nanohaloarchaeota archaeon]
MKVGVLFSGGKDSTLAMHIAEHYGYEVKYLLTVETTNPYSYMYHYPAINLTYLQAKALNKEIIKTTTTQPKEKELHALKKIIKKAKSKGIEGIITGAIRSTYQAERIQKIALQEGIEVFNPLWLKSDEEILNLLEKYNIKAVITRVAAYPLTQDFLGKEILEIKDKLLEMKKKYGVSAVGEGGELETFAVCGELFHKCIEIKKADIEWKNYEGNMIIRKAVLTSK